MPITGKVVAVNEGKKGVKGLNINIDSEKNVEVWCVGPNIVPEQDINIGCSVNVTGRWIRDEDGTNVYFAVETLTIL